VRDKTQCAGVSARQGIKVTCMDHAATISELWRAAVACVT
jgi:hypothetical protein